MTANNTKKIQRDKFDLNKKITFKCENGSGKY